MNDPVSGSEFEGIRMNRLLARRHFRRKIRGAAMVETLLSWFLLFLILLGMLHVFYFFAGQMFADYASYRGARSRAVGFADYLVQREVRVSAIGGSGKLVKPILHDSGTDISEYDASRFDMEKTLIQRYRMGLSWLEYEFWFGRSADSGKAVDTRLDIKIHNSGQTARVKSTFLDYMFPLSVPTSESDSRNFRLFYKKGIHLKGSADLRDHSTVYLKD